MPSYLIVLLFLNIILGLSKSAYGTSRSRRSIRFRKGGVGNAVRGACCWVSPTQYLLRMRRAVPVLLLPRSKYSKYCACFTSGRVPMVVNQPSSPSLVASSRVSSSSAFYAASTTSTSAHENMEGANITNNRSSPMQYPQQELHSLQPRGEEEEKQQKHYQVTQQQQQQHYRPLVIVLAGPTAVGKSDVASLLCSTTMAQEIMQTHFANYQYNPFPIPTTASDGTTVIDGTSYTSSTSNIRGHIISADSVQVYRANIDIGSNKPSAEELLKTPYHLVDRKSVV